MQDAAVTELKAMLNKRDVETARLREQRDQYQAEINERKVREQNKMASAQEFKALAEIRAVRSTTRQCVRRLTLCDRNASLSWNRKPDG